MVELMSMLPGKARSALNYVVTTYDPTALYTDITSNVCTASAILSTVSQYQPCNLLSMTGVSAPLPFSAGMLSAS